MWLMGWTAGKKTKASGKLRGIEAMGLGDVKMMFMVGAYLAGDSQYYHLLGVLSGSLIGIVLMLRQGKRNMQMPFALRRLSRHRSYRRIAHRPADRGMVCGTI